MKSAIVINVLVFCFLSVGDASSIEEMRTINKFKFTAMKTTEDLTLYMENLSSHAVSETRKFKQMFMELLNIQVAAELSNIENLVESSGKEGEDAENCYESAKQIMELKVTAQNFSTCSEPYLSEVNSLRAQMRTTIELSNRTSEQLDEWFMDCCSPDRVKLGKCLAAKIPTANATIHELKNNAKNLTTLGISLRNDDKNSRCYGKLLNVLIQDIRLVRSEAFECIERIMLDDKK